MKRIVTVAIALALGPGTVVVVRPGACRTRRCKPRMPQVCGTCHTVERRTNSAACIENVAFKSKAIQLKIDGATEIVRFDETTLKVVDGGAPQAGEGSCATSPKAARHASSSSRRTASRPRR